ncbi:MAG TPA: substrate-binding domain-containing protein, partial [Caldimonas sp.]
MQQTTGGSCAAAKGPSARAAGRRRSARPASLDSGGDFVVGLLVPINGSAGIWGPSSIACAQLAQAEINAAGGLLDRQLRLRVIDSSDEALEVGSVTAELMHSGAIDAIVGMHTSQVRQRVLRDVARQIPYVYTPLYEGGERTPGVFALGETPEQQLRPAIEYLIERYGARRWMFIGNDYVWPRVSHRLAARYVSDRGGELLGDRYLPFGAEDYTALLDEIRRLRPHAILLSLVGQDAIHFNRAFGSCGLSRDVFRLSCAIEENGLLAIGADNTDGLFVSAGYFASLDNDANMAFKERYYNHFGQRAPTLNALGQSTYEGV